MQYTEEQLSLIEDALNAYFHQAVKELQKPDLGDIERRSWETIRNRTKVLLTATPQPQGFTLQQVSDAFYAGYSRGVDEEGGGMCTNTLDREQYLATLTPAQEDINEASPFPDQIIKWLKEEFVKIDNPNNLRLQFNIAAKFIYDYWYENIYPGVIEQTKK